MEEILRFEHVSYAYEEEREALLDVCVKVCAGERVAVLGSNGAGKSTFFLLANGVLRPGAGRILFRGAPVGGGAKQLNVLRRGVGLVFQDPEVQLLGGSVEDEVSFGPMNLRLPVGEVRARVDARTGQLQAGGQAAVHCQQHQHHCRSGGFQCKAGQTPQAKLCAAAQAGGVIRQPDGPESLCTEQRDQQPGHQLALAAQQRGLCDAGRRPAHAYGSQCAHHQAQAAQRGHPALHRGLRLLLFLRPEAFQLLQQRCHKIAERRRQHKAQC